MQVEKTDAALDELRQTLAAARRAVVFTSAGISTESGIPDFRSPGGIWERYRPIDFSEFVESPDARREYWTRKFDSHETMTSAQPNRGHEAMAELVRCGAVRPAPSLPRTSTDCTRNRAFPPNR
ncbi:MAG: Sir2 family NAD-dependent protein deacetylase [Rhodospirillales bacterium]|jgi:NAD-dependent deacetylase|nr:Sir2 family NAD-dependent protein deacetylase [Rhodospirillales bacterium]MDP6805145.1 Sir2 family NAD-dependent protein deacetylase [Rhodospirillales bacterium]